jgi:hypothetical protein
VEEPTNHNLFNNPYQLTTLLQNFLVWLMVGDTVHCSSYTLPRIKSAVTSLLTKSFVNVSTNTFQNDDTTQALLHPFKKQNPTTPRYTTTWNISSFFTWCYSSLNTSTIVKNSSDDYFIYLQKRVCGLLAIFTFLRPIEISRIICNKQHEVKEGIFFHTIIKTIHDKHTPVFIPKIDNTIISPYHWTHQLREKNRSKSNSSYLFINSKHPDEPLSSSKIYLYLFEILQEMNLT